MSTLNRIGICYRTAGLLVAIVVAGFAAAHPIPSTNAPLDRIITNLTARVAESPQDAEAVYRLGRAHALAYANKRNEIRGFGEPEDFMPLPPDFLVWPSPNEGEPHGEPLTPEQVSIHLRLGVEHLVAAIRMKPEPRYYLALASLLETAGEECSDLDPMLVVPRNPCGPGIQIPPDPRGAHVDSAVMDLPDASLERVVRARIFCGTLDPGKYIGGSDEMTIATVWNRRDDESAEVRRIVHAILNDFWFEQTVDAYFIAHAIALATEAKRDTRPWGSLALRIGVEAGEGFLRVSRARERGEEEQARLRIVEAAVKELSKQEQSGGITPIVIALQSVASMKELLAPERHVAFDLDGTGRAQRWQWVQPTTAFLVWDPEHRGSINSGRQLFGSATWWVMFSDGYEALDSLDDDRDGVLDGAELQGLALWFDRNSNGVSDPGEVLPIGHFGVVGLSTRVTGFDGASPMSAEGVMFSDGRTLPTYDWIAHTAPNQPTVVKESVHEPSR